jgi:hypothetical protein
MADFQAMNRRIRTDRRRARECGLLFLMLLVCMIFTSGPVAFNLPTMVFAFFCFATMTCLLFGFFCRIRARLLAKQLRSLRQAVED